MCVNTPMERIDRFDRENMIKAVFFDIDGTLVSFKTHEISEGVRNALFELKEKGVRTFIATGRGLQDMKVLEGLPFDGYIMLNGQYCFTGDTVVFENQMNKEDLKTLVDYVTENPAPTGYCTPAGKRYNFRDERVDELNSMTHSEGYPAGDVSTVLEEKVYQCIVFINEEEERELMKKMPHSNSARWFHTFCDIFPKGSSKDGGMDHFLKYYGIDLKDTIAFGDGGNDAKMLRHAAISVAMGNAIDEVKALADYVTDDVDHDGIVTALKHFGVL